MLGLSAAASCIAGHRDVYHDGVWHNVPVYDRLAIATGDILAGPCLLEQPDTTIFIDPGLHGRSDEYWNLIIERAAQ